MKSKERIYSTSNPRRCKAVAFKFHILYLEKNHIFESHHLYTWKNSLLSWNSTLTTCNTCWYFSIYFKSFFISYSINWFHKPWKWKVKVKSLSGPNLCDPVDCSLLGSSIHVILQARILEWVVISFSRGSSLPRDRTQVSHIVGKRFNLWATRNRLQFNICQPLVCILSEKSPLERTAKEACFFLKR